MNTSLITSHYSLVWCVCVCVCVCGSGAWLGTVKHLLDNPLVEKTFPNEEIKKKSQSPYRIRCEDASFYFFHHMFEVKRDPTPGWGVWPVQTIDLLDFSGD